MRGDSTKSGRGRRRTMPLTILIAVFLATTFAVSVQSCIEDDLRASLATDLAAIENGILHWFFRCVASAHTS